MKINLSTKLKRIREGLDEHELYQPKQRNVTNKLSKFTRVTSHEVKRAMDSLQNKPCELDIIPTKFLKTSEDLLKVVTHIVNLSFEENKFAEEWKEALLKPLLKKPNLDLELRNCRPVSKFIIFIQSRGKGCAGTNKQTSAGKC